MEPGAIPSSKSGPSSLDDVEVDVCSTSGAVLGLALPELPMTASDFGIRTV